MSGFLQPIKAIHCIPNSRNHIYYRCYIYLGKEPTASVRKILDSIAELSLIDSFDMLGKKDFSELSKAYGDQWWTHFFPSFHLRKQLKKANLSKYKNKFGSKHFKGAMFADMVGGLIKGLQYDDDDDEPEDEEKKEAKIVQENVALKQDKRTEHQLKKDRLLFEKVIAAPKVEKDKQVVASFDGEDNQANFDENKSDICRKVYVFDRFLFDTDTVETIKEKLCISIKHDKNLEAARVIPEQIYTWSYTWDSQNSQEPFSVGHQWLLREKAWDVLPAEPPMQNTVFLGTEEEWLEGVQQELNAPIRRIRFSNNKSVILRRYNLSFNELYFRDALHDSMYLQASKEELGTLSNTYFRLYYPSIYFGHLPDMFERNDTFLKKTSLEYDEIRGRQALVKRADDMVLTGKPELSVFNQKEMMHLTQGSISVDLNIEVNDVEMRTLFNYFAVDETYPTILFHPLQNESVIKIHKKSFLEYPDLFQHWLDNSPYGLVLRVKVGADQYASIYIKNSKLECRMQWNLKEEATVDKLGKLFPHVVDLIDKFNQAPLPVKIKSPTTFTYGFLHIVQGLKIKIDHNKLSDFMRLFFPFFAVVIAPGAKSKSDTSKSGGKFGTYLRYRRVSNYQSQNEKEQRILYLLKNYQLTEKQLVDEISKNFNLTEERAQQEVRSVQEKHPHVFHTRKNLKMFRQIPRYRNAGIAVEIQGRDKPVVKVLGAANPKQLDEIMFCLNVALGYYDKTCNKKLKSTVPLLKPAIRYDQLKSLWLRQLDKIVAQRKDIIDAVYESMQDRALIKQKTSVDRERLQGWARICQGNRQPSPYSKEKLEKLGFQKKTGDAFYKKGNIQAIKLKNEEQDDIYWACDAKQNDVYIHVGFAKTTKKNKDACLPCCFKKHQAISASKHIRNKFLSCVGEETEDVDKEVDPAKMMYILQKAHLTHGRLGMLPQAMDIFFNQSQHHTMKLDKGNQLQLAKDGMFFMMGVKFQDHITMSLIQSIAIVLERTYKDVFDALAKALKSKEVLMSLEEGEIFRNFGENVANFEKKYPWSAILQLASQPGVLVEKGLNIFIFELYQSVVHKLLEADKTKQTFYPHIPNYAAQFDLWGDRESCFIVMNQSTQPVSFNPLVLATKTETSQPELDLDYTFSPSQDIVQLCREYWQSSGLRAKDSVSFLDAVIPPAYMMPQWLAMNIPGITGQVMDYYYRCAYLVHGTKGLIPVYRTSIIPGLKVYEWAKLSTLTVSLDVQVALCRKYASSILSFKQLEVFYNEKKEAIAIGAGNLLTIPIKKTKRWPKTMKSRFQESDIIQVDEILHKTTLQKHADAIQDRGLAHFKILEMNYLEENYKLFLFHLSYNMSEKQKSSLSKVMESTAKNNDKEKSLIKALKSIIKNSDFFVKLPKLPDTKNYQEKNYRVLCSKSKASSTCDPNHQCVWRRGKCLLGVWQNKLDEYVWRLAGSMINSPLLVKELLQLDSHNLSNMIDPTRLTVREGELIFREGNPIYFQQKIKELMNQDRHISKKQSRPKSYPVERTAENYIQLVLPDNLSLFRAISNVLFWEDSQKLPKETRNLGYQNNMQEIVALYLKNKCAVELGATLVTQTNIHIVRVAKELAKVLNRKIQLCTLSSYKVKKVMEVGSGLPMKIVVAPWAKKRGKLALGHATTFYAVYTD
jgi:hypothetical protein